MRALASRQRIFGEMQLAEGVYAQPTTSMFVYQALGNRARSLSTNRYAISSRFRAPARVFHRGDHHTRRALPSPPAPGAGRACIRAGSPRAAARSRFGCWACLQVTLPLDGVDIVDAAAIPL